MVITSFSIFSSNHEIEDDGNGSGLVYDNHKDNDDRDDDKKKLRKNDKNLAEWSSVPLLFDICAKKKKTSYVNLSNWGGPFSCKFKNNVFNNNSKFICCM